MEGELVVGGAWPGEPSEDDYPLGGNWHTDSLQPEPYDGKWQGAKTISRLRGQILEDWACRWKWLRD